MTDELNGLQRKRTPVKKVYDKGIGSYSIEKNAPKGTSA